MAFAPPTETGQVQGRRTDEHLIARGMQSKQQPTTTIKAESDFPNISAGGRRSLVNAIRD
jgi:hypothetical protein